MSCTATSSWIKDPKALLTGNHDMWLGVDTPGQYCSGFMAIKSNARTIALVRRWGDTMGKAQDAGSPDVDAQKMLADTLAAANDVDHIGLPPESFPNGKQYFEQFTNEQRANVAVVHNNHIVGKANKITRFREHKLWKVPEAIDVAVYVVTAAKFQKRQARLRAQLSTARVEHFSFWTNFTKKRLEDPREAAKVFQIMKTKEDVKKCIEVLQCTIDAASANSTCSDKDYGLSTQYLAIAAEHIGIVQGIARGRHAWGVVLEDDALVPPDFLHRLKLLVEGAAGPSQGDMFQLGDSFCELGSFAPPDALLEKSNNWWRVAPTTMLSWERAQSRTTGSYMISRAAAQRMAHSTTWVPQTTAVDFQLNYVIKKLPLRNRWAYPPLTCEGSKKYTISATGHGGNGSKAYTTSATGHGERGSRSAIVCKNAS